MSRFDGADDGEGAMTYGMWQHNAQLALKGKRGRKALSELKEALATLPRRELVAGNLVELSWDATDDDADKPTVVQGVCAVGALALHKGKTAEWLRDWNSYYSGEYDEGDCWSTAEAGKAVGLTYTLAWELSYRNDETYSDLTPSARWWAMYGWVCNELLGT